MTAQLMRETGEPHTLYNQLFDPVQLVIQAAGTVFQDRRRGRYADLY